MSGLHWQEWFDGYVVRLAIERQPYLHKSISLLNASRIITTRILCRPNSADEKDLKSLCESISEALKAADHSGLKTRPTDRVNQIFDKANEAIQSLCWKYGISLGLDREKNLAASSRSRGTTFFLMTFWPTNMNDWQHIRYTLEYVVEKGLTLRQILLLTYQKSLKEKSRIPSFSLNQKPGFFTIIPEIVKDFNLHGRRASKCQLHLRQQNTICQLDFQQEISDSCHGLHLLLDREIRETELADFPVQYRKEIVQTYRNIWRLDEKDAYYCARELSGCLVLLDPKKFKGGTKMFQHNDGGAVSVQDPQGLTPAPDMESAFNVSETSNFPTGGFGLETAEEYFESSNSASPPPGVIKMNWDEAFDSSCETFRTAQEPPLEVLSALGLLMESNPPQNGDFGTNDLFDDAKLPTGTPGDSWFPTDEDSSRQEAAMNFASSMAVSGPRAPQSSISFIRDAGNVRIIGSRINFVTNILHDDHDVRAGLDALSKKSKPAAFHKSYERQRCMHRQKKAVREWDPTPREFPLFLPRIKTCDLEEVVKDVFDWLYDVSSPLSILWLYDEGDDGNSRTSMIAQFLADVLGERGDLTASYFYTNPGGSSPTGEYIQSIIPTLSLQLTRCIPELEAHIALTAANDPWIFELSLDEQMKQLLVGPLQVACNFCEGNSREFPKLFLIHALEDCQDEDFQELFLQAFGKTLTLLQESRIPQKLMLLGKHTAHLRDCLSKTGLLEMVQHRLLPIS